MMRCLCHVDGQKPSLSCVFTAAMLFKRTGANKVSLSIGSLWDDVSDEGAGRLAVEFIECCAVVESCLKLSNR